MLEICKPPCFFLVKTAPIYQLMIFIILHVALPKKTSIKFVNP